MSAPAKYASGKYAYRMCDRCGQRYPYNEVREEWNGLMVCKAECWEPKHPQLEPKVYVDAQALYKPRPDNDQDGTVSAQIDSQFPSTAGGGS